MNPTTLPPIAEWPEWMARAVQDVGVREIPGVATHPRIAQFYDHTKLGGEPEDSSTPWCSAAMCTWMEEAGYQSPRAAAARSWLGWGDELKRPRVGCIAILWRGDPTSHQGHVAIYCHDVPQRRVMLLGGNQGNCVSYQNYSASRVLSYRWPRDLDKLSGVK